jgi:hypothetical protein
MKQNLLVEVTVNGKEENSQDFRHNHVHEFGLWPQGFSFLDEQAIQNPFQTENYLQTTSCTIYTYIAQYMHCKKLEVYEKS